jgi:hypothetical protein
MHANAKKAPMHRAAAPIIPTILFVRLFLLG